MSNLSSVKKVLVIKLGALGDFIQATGPFAALRRHHGCAQITLLTTPPFAKLASASGWFDEVWSNGRPARIDILAWIKLWSKLRSSTFQRVYDLQTSRRSSFYIHLFWPGSTPEWSGIANGCSHQHVNSRRDILHTLDRQI